MALSHQIRSQEEAQQVISALRASVNPPRAPVMKAETLFNALAVALMPTNGDQWSDRDGGTLPFLVIR
jgi:hypothetical protein